MERLSSPARLMIVSDLDHTMVDHYDTENLSLLRFNALWEAHYRRDSLLVFSTGRSPTLYKELRREKPMLTPDITIMSVGPEITYGNSMVPDEGWVKVLNQKWDKNIVTEETSKFSELTLQAETEQRPHKVSFYVKKDKAQEISKALTEKLEKRGEISPLKLVNQMQSRALKERKKSGKGQILKSAAKHGLYKYFHSDVSSLIFCATISFIKLYILPQGAGKGQALAYLHKKFTNDRKLPGNTLVCGDSGNDAELFTIPNVHGVMVKNAKEELLQWHAENAKNNLKIIHATERCAAGIIQAIGHFDLGPNTSPRDVFDSDSVSDIFEPGHEIVKFYLFLERWRRGETEFSEILLAGLKAVSHLSFVFVHPSGVEQSIVDFSNALRGCYGDKQGKQYRIWVDQVFTTEIGSNTWIVKFKKWESIGEERHGCISTVILSTKDVSAIEGFTWLQMHQTWLDDTGVKKLTDWFC